MMWRTILSLSVVAFAGTLFLAGCEEQKTPPPDSKSAPAPKDEKKTSAAPSAGEAVAASLAQTAADTSKTLACGKEGCTQPGNPAKSLVRDGKTISFCCDRCLGDYKKANNIQ